MNIRFLDLQRQYQEIGEELEKEVVACMRSCAYVEGPKVKELEKDMQSYLDVKHVITCGNGTDALVLALRAVGVMPGDEVITTPFSFFATSEAIAAVGATPVFADIQKSDFNLDPKNIEAKITSRTKAILPVHIFGAPADLDAIRAIAKAHNLKVVEDAAQAIGASYRGRKIGSGGSDATCFSFYPTKNLGGFGDGGMVTTDSDDVATVAGALKAHAGGKHGADAYRIILGEDPEGETNLISDDPLYDPYKYYNYLIGENSRLDSIQAAVLTVKLKRLDAYNEARRRIAARYLAELSDTPLYMTKIHEEGVCCYHQFAVLAPEKDSFIKYLSAHGVATGAFYPVPLHLQKAFRGKLGGEGTCPVAEEVCKHSVCLPVYYGLTEEEQSYVIDTIHHYFAGK